MCSDSDKLPPICVWDSPIRVRALRRKAKSTNNNNHDDDDDANEKKNTEKKNHRMKRESHLKH